MRVDLKRDKSVFERIREKSVFERIREKSVKEAEG